MENTPEIPHDSPLMRIESDISLPDTQLTSESTYKNSTPPLAPEAPLGQKRHDTYYFEMLHLKAEQTLFRIPKSCFNKSEFFRDMFSLPLPDKESGEEGREGTSDENPIVLEGVQCVDLEHFLDVLLPRRALFRDCSGHRVTDGQCQCSFSRSPQPLKLSVPEWVRVLDLAEMWGFKAIRLHVIKEFANHSIDEVEKTVLAHKYHIDEWYADMYFALAKRQEPLTIEESRRIGWETSMKIAWVREKKYSLASARTCSSTVRTFGSKKGGGSGTCTQSIYNAPMSDVELGGLVKDTFLECKTFGDPARPCLHDEFNLPALASAVPLAAPQTGNYVLNWSND